jgi:3-isopropylmalate dehydrogenase
MMTSTNGQTHKRKAPAKLLNFLSVNGLELSPICGTSQPVIGVLEGTGIGPDVIAATLQVLKSVELVCGLKFDVQMGGLIGEEGIREHGQWLPDDTRQFCAGIFEQSGAILSGPGGGRYVYDLRRHFDLFCKFVPVHPSLELARAGKVSPQFLKNVDMLIIRDNIGGVYQGQWTEQMTNGGRVVEHSFSYREHEVRRLIEVAARAALVRKGNFLVIVKDGGIPAMTALWRDVGTAVATRYGVEARFMNIDFAAYELIQNPSRFDVIVAPNLFGDIIADICGVLVSTRGVTFSGNFSSQGHGVYQTNHGCAMDLAGADVANPGGQILSLAMLLRESFGLDEAAALVEKSLAAVWRAGWRTLDIAEPGCQIIGTGAMGEKVAEQMMRSAPTLQLV